MIDRWKYLEASSCWIRERDGALVCYRPSGPKDDKPWIFLGWPDLYPPPPTEPMRHATAEEACSFARDYERR